MTTLEELIRRTFYRQDLLVIDPAVTSALCRLDLGVCTCCGRLAKRSDDPTSAGCLDKKCPNHSRNHLPVRWFQDRVQYANH